MSIAKLIFNFSRPINLFFVLLTYFLGIGLSRYLGAGIFAEQLFIGGAAVMLIFSVSSLLAEYFSPDFLVGESPKRRNELHSLLLLVIVAVLGIAAVLVYILQLRGLLNVETVIILILMAILAVFYSVPPVRLMYRGLGELVLALQIACLSPAFAFFLQYGTFHRILVIFTFPLFLLYLAYFIASGFPTYLSDIKYERKTLLSILSWQTAIPIHNILIASAYLFFVAVPFFGVPVSLVWIALLTLPVGVYQMHIAWKIADGVRPDWKLFMLTATVSSGLTSYLIGLTFWLK